VIRHICNSLNQGGVKSTAINQYDIHSLLIETGAVAFADRAEELWGTEYFGLPIIPPSEIANTDYDKIVVAGLAVESILVDLIGKYGVPPEQIISEPARLPLFMRDKFACTVAPMIYARNTQGSVAECGVFKGDFSKVINACFPDRTLYLFDTFDGFSVKDTAADETMTKSGNTHSYFKETSVDLVLSKLPHRENACVRQGWFPETAEGIDDTFAFVVLDFDLYSPIKAGLEWFYPRLERGGVILIHDYFHSNYDCNKAVDEFCVANGVFPLPIGDVLSVAIIKQ
jgi:O-methyltransferase